MSQEEEEKAIEWLKKEITRNKIHIQDCKEAVDVKFYYDLDDEIELTQKDLDAEETLLTIVETQQAELKKKDKMIDKMAENLTSPIYNKKEVIEYFTRLTEGEYMNG